MPSILLHHIWAGLGRYFSYILYPISPKNFPNEFLDEHERIDVNFFMNDCFIYVSSYFLFQRRRCYHKIRLHFIFTLNVLTVAQTCFITIFLNGITGHNKITLLGSFFLLLKTVSFFIKYTSFYTNHMRCVG